MKIKKIKSENFRNLKNVSVKFGDINILTGKNSAGKTNLTQLLNNCLNINDKAKDYFGENIVTYGAGYNKTKIEVKIGDINAVFQQIENTDTGKRLSIHQPREITFKHTISKRYLSSTEHSLDYTGEEYFKEGVSVNFLDGPELKDKQKEFDKVLKKDVYKRRFAISADGSNNSELVKDGVRYFDIFKTITENQIINHSPITGTCSNYIYDFIISKPQNIDTYKDIVERIKKQQATSGKQNFPEAKFINLLADIQSNNGVFEEFNKDLEFFTDGIIKKIEVNTDGSRGFKGDIFITTPHGPTELGYISSGSAIIVYFVCLKNWLKLSFKDKSYMSPQIMIFDELDSSLHPSLIQRFSELLRIISHKVQLFITTHSTTFIDQFDKTDIYLLKDSGSFEEKTKVFSNVLSYDTIIKNLGVNEQTDFMNSKNSDLFINGYIDDIFPISLN